ncbi:CBS domain-containing protein [Burkholderia sp. PU8-34]
MYRVNEIMSRDVVCVAPTDTIRHAAELMLRFDIGVLPVCEDRELVAIVTDRDLAVRALPGGHSPDTPVRVVASMPVEWCVVDDAIGEVRRRMADAQLHRMPVIDHDGRLVGMVSLGDIAIRAARAPRGELANTLDGVSLPRRS